MKTHRLILLVPSVLAVCIGLEPLCAQSRMDAATAAAAPSTMETATAGAAATTGPEAIQPDGSGEQGTGTGAARTDKPVITAMPATPGSVVLSDPATKQQFLQAMQRYYQYRANGYDYRSRVFEWQLISSRLIFLTVLLLVGVGVYFAGVQFQAAMKAARVGSRAGTPPAESGPSLATEFAVSAQGITVNSSVMGLIILALSLGFFYLYLVYVYPITDVM